MTIQEQIGSEAISPLGRRVLDRVSGEYGTVVEALPKNRYRVAWDRPTPYEATATPRIPNAYFQWADASR